MNVSEETVLTFLKEKKLKLATAESCTGGLISAMLTNISGSSQVFDRGFVTYSNQSKMDMLGVKPETLEKYGAVSSQTAVEMAQGAIKFSEADIGVSVTGVAGPKGGSPEKPVGTVFIGLSYKDWQSIQSTEHHFEGTRTRIRELTVQQVFQKVLKSFN